MWELCGKKMKAHANIHVFLKNLSGFFFFFLMAINTGAWNVYKCHFIFCSNSGCYVKKINYFHVIILHEFLLINPFSEFTSERLRWLFWYISCYLMNQELKDLSTFGRLFSILYTVRNLNRHAWDTRYVCTGSYILTSSVLFLFSDCLMCAPCHEQTERPS